MDSESTITGHHAGAVLRQVEARIQPGSIIQICPQCAKDTPFRACLMVVAEVYDEGVTAFTIEEVHTHNDIEANALSAAKFLWNEVVFTGGLVVYMPADDVLKELVGDLK